MNQQAAIEYFESTWEEPNGFFYRLRQGEYDAQEAARVLETISSLILGIDTPIEKRLVSLLWYMPLFAQWQRDRIREAGMQIETYDRFVTQLTNILEEKLGIP